MKLESFCLLKADSSYFTIQNYTTFGDLEVNADLDMETRSSYTVIVMAQDSVGHNVGSPIQKKLGFKRFFLFLAILFLINPVFKCEEHQRGTDHFILFICC